MDLHGPGDGADRARADPKLARGFERRLAQLGMRGQPQIIVRRQVDDLLSVKRTDWRLLVFQHAQLEVRALGLEFVELVGEIRERIDAGCSGQRETIPVSVLVRSAINREQLQVKGTGIVLEVIVGCENRPSAARGHGAQ